MLQPLSYQPGDRIGGRFQVHEALAGGMGEVYLCLDLEENLPYALKTFQRQYATAELREAFFEEVATWVALERHPNIVRCFFLGTLDNRPFMFLEWIPEDERRGTALRSWLQHGPLALQLALDFTIDICRGLIHAGEKVPGIVHRDLKPENVLIDPSRQAKITDFGLATAARKARLQLQTNENTTDRWNSLHGAGGVVGTPPYMPPEQWHGAEIDARADIYAVGCMLYELVTGQPPFSAHSLRGFYEQHCRAPIPSLSEQPLLAPILMHCLAKRPDGRFNTVNDLLAELEHVYLRQFGQPAKPPLPETRFTALDHYNRGVTYHSLGQLARAAEDFSTAIDLYPTFAEAYLLRGFCYAELEQMAHAVADIRCAFEMGPVVSSLSDMYYNRGTFWREQGFLDNAVADFTRAIDLDPTDAQSYTNRGLCHYDRQRFIEAITDFSRALAFKPDHIKAYNNRGNVLALLGDDARAITDFTRAIELLPTYTKAYNNRAMSYQKLGLHSEAISDYRRAIELDPSYGLAYMNLGALLLKLDRQEDALEVFERAAQLGIPHAIQIVSQIRQMPGLGPAHMTHSDPEAAFEAFLEAFQRARSLEEMRMILQRFPMLNPHGFIQLVEPLGARMSPEWRREFSVRLGWLRQIAEER